MIRDHVQSEPESRTAAVSACFRDCLSHVSSKTVSDRNPNHKNSNPLRRKTQEQNYRFAHQIPSWVNPSEFWYSYTSSTLFDMTIFENAQMINRGASV